MLRDGRPEATSRPYVTWTCPSWRPPRWVPTMVLAAAMTATATKTKTAMTTGDRTAITAKVRFGRTLLSQPSDADVATAWSWQCSLALVYGNAFEPRGVVVSPFNGLVLYEGICLRTRTGSGVRCWNTRVVTTDAFPPNRKSHMQEDPRNICDDIRVLCGVG